MDKKYELLLLKSKLKAYYRKRQVDSRQYFSVLGRFFGYSKEQTLDAILALYVAIDVDNETIERIPYKHYQVLRQSEIGRIIHEWEESSDIKISYKMPPPSDYRRTLHQLSRTPMAGSLSRVIHLSWSETERPSRQATSFFLRSPQDILQDFPRVVPQVVLDEVVSPYPLKVTAAHGEFNNALHEYLINTSVAVLDIDCRIDGDSDLLQQLLLASDKDVFDLLKKQSWYNTPFSLAIKMGRWQEVSVLIARMSELVDEHIQYIVEQRDSMGLMPLSYALLLRAPEEVITFLLKHTSKKTYFTDSRYIPKHLRDKPYEVHEDGYYLEGEKIFSIYTLSPKELYEQPLPHRISIMQGVQITDHSEFMVIEADIAQWQQHGGDELDKLRQQFRALHAKYLNYLKDEKQVEVDVDVVSAQLLTLKEAIEQKVNLIYWRGDYHPFLRNLLFFMADLGLSEGLELETNAITVSTAQKWQFDMIYNYPKWADCRNQAKRLEPGVMEALSAWMQRPMVTEVSLVNKSPSSSTSPHNST